SSCAAPMRGEPGRLRLEPLEGFGFLDHEPRMGAGADLVEFVLDRDLERYLSPVDRNDAHRDLDRHPHQGRGEMLHGHFHSDRILARIRVLEDKVSAGIFDVADHRGGGIGARLLAHEADGALRADRDAVDAGGARAKAWLHRSAPKETLAEGLKSVVRGQASGEKGDERSSAYASSAGRAANPVNSRESGKRCKF